MDSVHDNDDDNNEHDGKPKGEEKKKFLVKTALDLQRLKLSKLMKNPDKPIVIPEPHKPKDFLASVPSFVRNVMGSSAGAGSGEFHVYRHLRRKEYARQKFISAKSAKERLDDEYHQKLEQNRLEAEAKTAKKRAKRLKKKQKMKQHGKKPRKQSEGNSSAPDKTDSEDGGGDTSQSDTEAATGNEPKDSDVTTATCVEKPQESISIESGTSEEVTVASTTEETLTEPPASEQITT